MPVKRLQARGILPTAGLDLPDFLVIGAQKAGTTWLARNLDVHPEISMARRPGASDPTEIRYFDRHFHRSLRYYARHFEGLPGRLRGDKSPNYCTLPASRVHLIARLLPEARIVLLLRNPIDRAWSNALMNLVTLPGRRYEDVPEDRFHAHFQRARRRGEYAWMLGNWWSAYPRDRVHVGFFEDVADDPTGLLADVLRFLDAGRVEDWSGYPVGRKINRGAGIPLPAAYRELLTDMYREDIERLGEWFGERADRWLRQSR